MTSYISHGRNRQSADIESEIYELFCNHPQSTTNDDGNPVLPGNAVLDILRTFSQSHDTVELMSREDEEAFKQLLEKHPDAVTTPDILFAFIAACAKQSAQENAQNEADASVDPDIEEERTEYEYDNRSRSGSPESIGTSVYRPSSRPSSRPPSRGGPRTPSRDSPFDTSRRQRTTPLTNAPSSWPRRPPPQRRRSDAGMHGRDMSDSEVCKAHICAFDFY